MQIAHSTKRTDPTTEQLIVTRIAQGVRYIDISEETNTPVPTIKKIRKRNDPLLAEVKQQIIKKEAVIVVSNLQKAHKLIAQRLDRALAGQERIADRDLVNIAREMHNQAEISDVRVDDNEQAQRTAKRSEAIQQAIADDDHVKLLHLLFPTNEDA